MACESFKRVQDYLKVGCNAFEAKRPVSRPMGFWTEQDVLQYLRGYNFYQLPYASIYGDIVETDGVLSTTGVDRTGCMFCLFGINQEKGVNRFQRMKKIHPQIYNYCIKQLGIGEVLDFIGVRYA